MKPKEMKPDIVYRVIDKETGQAQVSYSRAYCDEYDFRSPDEARNANCHGMFKDDKYKIDKYRVTYELIEDDVDGDMQTDEEKEAAEKRCKDLFSKLGKQVPKKPPNNCDFI